MLFVFLKELRNGVKILYGEHNAFYLWSRHLESAHFKTSTDLTHKAGTSMTRFLRQHGQPSGVMHTWHLQLRREKNRSNER
ncbi:IS66 family insertion sequence element accessory protein TnpB [Pseudomonas kitaguniensis]|uniref:IS66 family insertion sequence element accessory protein TnpB n=1 Tax=Pseudomonas kitaguniensis TaxID=2607908 RepID=UPI001F4F3D1A|nr:IS66 family insertion sequence element accessory protein TnpB [Pseudomonas kitaguniensis]